MNDNHRTGEPIQDTAEYVRRRDLSYGRKLAVLLAATTGITSGVGGARAQEATAQPSGGVEDIVVTARKFAESSQSVPGAITAFSNAALESRNVQTIESLAALAPNLNVNSSSASISGTVISIRGISDNNPTNLLNDPPVGIYLDGIYLGRAAGGIFDLVDIERVEVLRGPQGALFGRNTTGGAVSITSRSPAATPGVQQKMSYGRFNEWMTRTRVDFGELANTGIFASFGYAHRQSDGWVDNILQPSNRDPGAINTDTAVGSLRGEWGGVRVEIHGDYQNRKGVAPAAQVQGTSPAVLAYYSQSPNYGGGPFNVYTERQGSLALDFLGRSKGELWGVSGSVEVDLSPAVTLKSITGYRSLDTTEWALFSGNSGLRGPVITGTGVQILPVTLFQAASYNKQHQFSQELQLLGDTDRLRWVLGAYYFDEDVRQSNPQSFNFVINANLSAPQQRTVAYTGGARSYAAFGQASFTPAIANDRIEITLGGRYTRDERRIDQQDTVFGVPQARRNLKRVNEDFSYTGSVKYAFTDDVNVYARYSTGYKSGGFNAADLIGNGYDPEKVKAAEIGLKSQFFDRRLRFNLSAFHTDYTDRQISVLVASPTGGATNTTQNAGRAVIKGIELEVTAVPVVGLTLEGSLGYIDPKYKRYDFRETAGGPLIDVSDEARFHYQTKLTAHAGVQYQFPETSFGQPSIRVDYDHTGRRYFQPLDRVSPLNSTIVDPGFDNLQARFALSRLPLGAMTGELAVYGRNLLNDTDHIVSGIDFGALGFAEAQYVQPRTYGVSLSLEF